MIADLSRGGLVVNSRYLGCKWGRFFLREYVFNGLCYKVIAVVCRGGR